MTRPSLPPGFRVIGPHERRHRAGRVPGSEVDVLLDFETPTASLLSGINHLAPGGRIPLHHHDYEELQFILSGAVLFLASDDASFITGAVLPVDGGWLLG